MFNLLSYSFYLLIVFTVILYIGHLCYRHGHVYVAQLIPENEQLTQQINKTLLVGYYLMNLGYSVFALSRWEKVNSLLQVFESVVQHLSYITLLLASLHYCNMLFIKILLNNKSKS